MRLENFKVFEKEDDSYVLECQFSPNSDKIGALYSDGMVEIYDAKSFKPLATRKFNFLVSAGMKMGKDGIWIANGSERRIQGFDYRDLSDTSKPILTLDVSQELSPGQLTCFDVTFDGLLIAIGTENTVDNKKSSAKQKTEEEEIESDSRIIFADLRADNPGKILGSYTESHSDTINQVKFKSHSRDWLVSGGVDSLTNTFDLRNETEDDALQQTLNAESPVNKVGWVCHPSLETELPEGMVYAITDDSRFRIYDTLGGDELCKFDDFADSEKFLVDCFVSQAAVCPLVCDAKGGVVIAKWIKNLGRSLAEKDFQPMNILEHTDLIRCACFDENSQILVTGGEDGVLAAFHVKFEDNIEKKIAIGSSKKKRKLTNKPY